MAHKKAGGSTSLGRDSSGQRLGVKIAGGQHVRPGGIIVRQRGSRYRAGPNVRRGGDDTLFAVAEGIVQYRKRSLVGFNGRRLTRNMVSVTVKPATA